MVNLKCDCWECQSDNVIFQTQELGITLTEDINRMFLCPKCGNKRCPRATSHREPCSGSNEPGQLGSRFGIYPNPNKRLFDFVEGKDQVDS
jgi:hypothetical protein